MQAFRTRHARALLALFAMCVWLYAPLAAVARSHVHTVPAGSVSSACHDVALASAPGALRLIVPCCVTDECGCESAANPPVTDTLAHLPARPACSPPAVRVSLEPDQFRPAPPSQPPKS